MNGSAGLHLRKKLRQGVAEYRERVRIYKKGSAVRVAGRGVYIDRKLLDRSYLYAFFKNSVRSTSPFIPSTLHSMSSSSSVRRIFFAFVPRFSVTEVPFTFKSFTSMTVSPFASTVPCASFVMIVSSDSIGLHHSIVCVLLWNI